MSSRSWRGTALFFTILVVMGATVGLRLYGIGEQVAGSPTAAASVGESTSSTGDASTPSSTPSPSASSPSPASTGTTVITGDAVDTRWGPVQVEVTFSGDTITAVKTVQAPDSNGRDIQINNQALPILQQEALASQSADIDTVSGATYTSEGYIQSLQSAIDQR
jgi:uncharacterized protein with FMN-binding domain